MDQEIRTIFENGVFRPVDPTVVPEQGEFFVIVRSSSTTPNVESPDDAEELRQQRDALKVLFEQAESLPLEVADDGFSGADHDAALYGDQR
jgi:hypothetical protein